jgi:hypothetical protein
MPYPSHAIRLESGVEGASQGVKVGVPPGFVDDGIGSVGGHKSAGNDKQQKGTRCVE